MKKYCEPLFYTITAIMIATGFFMHYLGEVVAFKIIHVASGVLFSILLIVHVILNRKKIGKK